MSEPLGAGLLARMVREHPTELWNDGCDAKLLARAIARGATGATSNPVLVLEAIEADLGRWREEARRLSRENPSEGEEELAWRIVEALAVEAADLLAPQFAASHGSVGRLSLQVNPRHWRSAEKMVEQAAHFATLRPNMAVKLPTVPAGLVAMEELTARGISINATVSFSVPQALAVAAAVERGRARAKAAGRDLRSLTPWVTIMVGRLDDHLRDEAQRLSRGVDPEIVRQASTAVFRKAYQLLKAHPEGPKLLAAAMRSHHHWSEFIGGEVVITVPAPWQDKFDASGVEVKRRIDDEVDPSVIAELRRLFPDFTRAYDEDGMLPSDFASFGPSRKTLHQFLAGYDRLLAFVRGVMLE